MGDPLLHDAAFRAWEKLPVGEGYENLVLWTGVGDHQLDQKLTQLADLYLAAAPARREAIRCYFENRREALDALWLYIRRIALLLWSSADVVWLRRGLAVAAIEGGRVDYRDTIVSLVILRHAAEHVGIVTRPYFDEAIPLVAADAVFIFTNARDHRDRDVRYTVSAFGPPEWAAEIEEDRDDEVP